MVALTFAMFVAANSIDLLRTSVRL